MLPPSVAFVIPSCGDDVVGGAQSLCLQIAAALKNDLRIEILTTCALDEVTWRNHYPVGHTHVGGVHVQRFPVDAPTRMRAQGPRSGALTAYLRAHATRFERIGFFGYGNPTSYLNLPLVAERSVLWPLAHDAWPLALPMWDELFALAGHVVYGSTDERAAIERRFPNITVASTLIASGVPMPAGGKPERFRDRYEIGGSFLLCLDGIDAARNCEALIADYCRYYDGERLQPKLVLLGEARMDVPVHPGIVHVGRVDEATKWDALAAAALVVLPADDESGSLAAFEAWAARKPVLVNAAAAGVVDLCRRAGGGLWYANADEFAVALDLLSGNVGARLGAQGRDFVETHFRQDDETECYRRILNA